MVYDRLEEHPESELIHKGSSPPCACDNRGAPPSDLEQAPDVLCCGLVVASPRFVVFAQVRDEAPALLSHGTILPQEVELSNQWIFCILSPDSCQVNANKEAPLSMIMNGLFQARWWWKLPIVACEHMDATHHCSCNRSKWLAKS